MILNNMKSGCLLLFIIVSVINAFVVEPLSSNRRRRSAITITNRNSIHTLSAAATTNSERIESCDIAIFGGGFGGLYTALAVSREARLRGMKNLDIRLIEPTETFVFLPLLYDLTVGTASELEVCPAYKDLLQGTGIRHVRASFEGLNIDNDNDSSTKTTAMLKPIRNTAPDKLNFRYGVIAVGASPDDILASIPGAQRLAQPFYTADDAKATRRLLNRLEEEGKSSSVAIVGGGYGGVELSACVKRKLKNSSHVTLFSRGPPMAGTRAEPLIDKALQKLGVIVENCDVISLEESDNGKITLNRIDNSNENSIIKDDWDAVLWTAGSRPSPPVGENCGISDELLLSKSGRLVVKSNLRCSLKNNDTKASIWSLGDCAEVVDADPALPKTAQVAMQQAETVASNIIATIQSKEEKNFVYQDLGSMLALGGPNGALVSPKDGTFAPIFAPLLDTVGGALDIGDRVVSSLSPTAKQIGLPTPDSLGLSLGSHGLGVDTGTAPGTLAGTLTGAVRRAVYSVRMPTNQQRAVSFVSAALSTAIALAKEAESERQNTK